MLDLEIHGEKPFSENGLSKLNNKKGPISDMGGGAPKFTQLSGKGLLWSLRGSVSEEGGRELGWEGGNVGGSAKICFILFPLRTRERDNNGDLGKSLVVQREIGCKLFCGNRGTEPSKGNFLSMKGLGKGRCSPDIEDPKL